VLHGADLHVVFADGGGVIERGGGRLQGRDAEAVEIGADEGDAAAGGNRVKLDGGVDVLMVFR
jgi:hypothetical protein